MPVLLVLMLGLEFYQHATSSGPAGSDFAIYHKAATRLAADPDSLYREITKGQPEDWIYPPPAILPILPFRNFGIAPGFFVWMALVYVALAASGLAWHELAGRAGPAWKPVLLFTALTPGFHAARNGQMDPFVLLICLAYLIALGRDRAALAGISLALGVWIKIYPAVLLVMALFHPKARRVFTWFAGAMVAVPVIVLPIVPLRVEVAYFGEYLPAVAQNTEPHIYNQSLIGFLSRQSLGPFPAVFDSWAIVPVAAVHKAAAALVVLTFVGIVLWRIRARGFATDVSDAFRFLQSCRWLLRSAGVTPTFMRFRRSHGACGTSRTGCGSPGSLRLWSFACRVIASCLWACCPRFSRISATRDFCSRLCSRRVRSCASRRGRLDSGNEHEQRTRLRYNLSLRAMKPEQPCCPARSKSGHPGNSSRTE